MCDREEWKLRCFFHLSNNIVGIIGFDYRGMFNVSINCVLLVGMFVIKVGFDD